ncbi:unnamed protein product [Gongylonema pulchrum]|uniref:BLOC-1-related complex subunit 7 n=1 Tax=Gongylonema pulchrum TaxID=637853 RepID=A0A183F0A9_9BILA|nr:unnamed protein product [Gongylonema pulchrum]
MNTGTSAWPSTSSAAASSAQQPGHPDMAQKVSEIFMKAGEAFQELGSLVAVLQSKDDNERLHVNCRKWTETYTDNLHDALSRFATDLRRISASVQEREM